MVRIRLRRMGRKKAPFYRIVAIDSRGRRDGKYLEKIGHYNPITDPFELVIDEEKALKWLLLGAQPSDTVRSFFSRRGIMVKYDLMKKGYTEEQIAEEMKKWEVLQLERQRRQEAIAAQENRDKKTDEPDEAESEEPESTEPVEAAATVAPEASAPSDSSSETSEAPEEAAEKVEESDEANEVTAGSEEVTEKPEEASEVPEADEEKTKEDAAE